MQKVKGVIEQRRFSICQILHVRCLAFENDEGAHIVPGT